MTTTPGRDPRLLDALTVMLGASGPRERFAYEIAERRVEYDAVAELLVRSATEGLDAEEVEQVARAVAAGCLGERHLWRDLGLSDRPTLRLLLESYFLPLASENVMDMRWKKFIYRKLCRWGGFHTCQAPSCSACTSYPECFGDGL